MSLIFKHFIYMEFEHRWKDVKKLRVFTLKKKSNKTEGRLFYLSRKQNNLSLVGSALEHVVNTIKIYKA